MSTFGPVGMSTVGQVDMLRVKLIGTSTVELVGICLFSYIILKLIYLLNYSNSNICILQQDTCESAI
jgi:hypothetical protein